MRYDNAGAAYGVTMLQLHGVPTTVVILCEANDVLAHLAVYQHQAGIGSETLEIGMPGGIVVAREQRRRGYGRVVVQRAHELLRGRNVLFSILFASEPAVYASSDYKLMQNVTRFTDHDGTVKTLVFRASMYAELSGRRWPDQLLDLREPVASRSTRDPTPCGNSRLGEIPLYRGNRASRESGGIRRRDGAYRCHHRRRS
jgi:hypothetical protein